MITEKITGMSLMPEEAKKTTSRRETERTAVREGQHPIVFVTGRGVVEVLKRLGFHERGRLQEFLEEEYPVEVEAASVELVRPKVDIGDSRGFKQDDATVRGGRIKSHPSPLQLISILGITRIVHSMYKKCDIGCTKIATGFIDPGDPGLPGRMTRRPDSIGAVSVWPRNEEVS